MSTLRIAGSEVWRPPVNWTSGDRPVIYRSFDREGYILLKNGAHLVPGKVHSQSQHSAFELIKPGLKTKIKTESNLHL